MDSDRFTRSVAAWRRKLQGLSAVAKNPAATASERANAETLKKVMEQRLRDAGAPAGDWSDGAFRFGRWLRDMRTSTAPASPKGNWTDHVHRLGKATRRTYKKLKSE